MLATSICDLVVSQHSLLLKCSDTHGLAQPTHRYSLDEGRSGFWRVFNAAHDFRQPVSHNSVQLTCCAFIASRSINIAVGASAGAIATQRICGAYSIATHLVATKTAPFDEL